MGTVDTACVSRKVMHLVEVGPFFCLFFSFTLYFPISFVVIFLIALQRTSNRINWNRMRDGMDAANAASIPSRNRFQLILLLVLCRAIRKITTKEMGKYRVNEKNKQKNGPTSTRCMTLRDTQAVSTVPM